MAFRVLLASSALADLQAIHAWYNEKGVSEMGTRLVREVVGRIEHLADHPDMGRVVPEFGQSFLREIIHPPFRIIYRRDADAVRIVRIWRGERRLDLPEQTT